MAINDQFLTGVVEGFYGRAWTTETRIAYADYLSLAGMNTYIYCPKEDVYLRKQWASVWPDEQWRDLQSVAAAYREKSLNWGVGLSPMELYRSYGVSEREQLRVKVDRLGELEAPLLAILFDDMPGDLASLASRQAEIVADVCLWSPGTRIIICPTYYSFDPVLHSYFGKMPVNYWSDLGVELPADVDVFWTGNEVCSTAISEADIGRITDQLGRRVMLWDNYPVNDGAKRCDYLYTDALAQRSTGLRESLTGHLCNPMNQGLLSLPALNGLADLYGLSGLAEDALRDILGLQVWEKLSRDKSLFQAQGRAGLGESECRELADEYAALPGPAALEIAGWLRGEYAFDPACLTG